MRKLSGLLFAAALLCGIPLVGAERQTPPAKMKPLPVTEFYKHFEQVPVDKDLGELFGKRVYIGTAGNAENYNSLTLGWGATGILWSRPVAIVYIRENRFSYRYFEDSPVYVLSWYSPRHTKAVYKIFGGRSGRDTDKEKLAGFTPVETPDGGVTYLQADKVVVCKKLMRQRVPGEFMPQELQGRLNRDGLVHIQYTGEVLSVWKKKSPSDQMKSAKNEKTAPKSLYDCKIVTGKGETLDLANYRGKVVLIVNTATGCGFTPQYAPIEQLYRTYHDKGLEILDIPCNQFGGQAPGTDEEIREFCTVHFNTTFPQMKKADVNGPNELPLYTWLKSQKGFQGFDEHKYKALLEKKFAQDAPDWYKKPDIKWNFTKFVVDRQGNVVARFEPTADMAKVEECIKSLL